MSKWKCDICGKEFDNFHAQGFNNKIYCPLCFFKEENRRLKEVIEEVREVINGYIPNEEAMCKVLNKIEFILEKAKENK